MHVPQHRLPAPARPPPVPRVTTFQRKSSNRRVVNEEELLHLLSQYGEVRVVEFNASTSFHQQLEAMRGTGVLVSVHTSNLANAPLLQPGSAIVEIIQVRQGSHDGGTCYVYSFGVFIAVR